MGGQRRLGVGALTDMVQHVIDDLPKVLTSTIAAIDLAPRWVPPTPCARDIARNLLTIAHRYGGEEVLVTVGTDDGRGSLDIADSGVGVPLEKRTSIFETYETTGHEHTVTAAIGLGLTASRQLARLRGDDVEYIHGSPPRF